MIRSSKEELGESHGINILAVLVNTHVTGCDFVNKDNFVAIVPSAVDADCALANVVSLYSLTIYGQSIQQALLQLPCKKDN